MIPYIRRRTVYSWHRQQETQSLEHQNYDTLYTPIFIAAQHGNSYPIDRLQLGPILETLVIWGISSISNLQVEDDALLLSGCNSRRRRFIIRTAFGPTRSGRTRSLICPILRSKLFGING